MSAIQLFSNDEFELRITPNGDGFLVAAPDLARALGYSGAREMVRHLPADEKRSVLEPSRSANGVTQAREMWFVTEPGFYHVVGQRQPARIKQAAARAQVERFQRWVHHEVLPSIRRTGHYGHAIDEPLTYTWDEVTTVIRQRYGIQVSVAVLTRMLRTAGILRQTGVPKKAHQHFFWFTGSAWEIHPHAVPFLTRQFEDTARQLQDFRFIQTRLELELGTGTT